MVILCNRYRYGRNLSQTHVCNSKGNSTLISAAAIFKPCIIVAEVQQAHGMLSPLLENQREPGLLSHLTQGSIIPKLFTLAIPWTLVNCNFRVVATTQFQVGRFRSNTELIRGHGRHLSHDLQKLCPQEILFFLDNLQVMSKKKPILFRQVGDLG